VNDLAHAVELHVSVKWALFVTCVVTIGLSGTRSLLGIAILLSLLLLWARVFPVNLGLVLAGVAGLVVAGVLDQDAGLWVGLIVPVGRLACVTMSLSLLASTTRPSEVFGLLHSISVRLSVLRYISYLSSMMVSLLPSIRDDLERSLIAEQLKRGRRLGLLSLRSWVSVTVNLLVRASVRSHTVAETVVSRGYAFDGPFTAVYGALDSLSVQDIVVGLVLGAAIVGMRVILQ
jgi:energy-coupling factor transporter transmembrane protein EcfT